MNYLTNQDTVVDVASFLTLADIVMAGCTCKVMEGIVCEVIGPEMANWYKQLDLRKKELHSHDPRDFDCEEDFDECIFIQKLLLDLASNRLNKSGAALSLVYLPM